jgi:hypothetical protein
MLLIPGSYLRNPNSRWVLLGDLEALSFVTLAMVNHADLRNGEMGKGKMREGTTGEGTKE